MTIVENNKKNLFYKFLAVSVLLITTLLFFFNLNDRQPIGQVIHSLEKTDEKSTSDSLGVQHNTTSEPNLDDFINNLVAQLIQHHQHNVHEISVQVSFLDLKRMLTEQYPNQADILFERILKLAFPELAESILVLLQKLEVYESWYQDNLLTLSQQSHSDRYEAIWNKRYAIFGKLADQIWPTEQASDELQLQREQLQLTIQALNNDNVNSIHEKLFILTATLSENSDQSAMAELSQQGTISNLFFGLSSVQQELKAMPPEQRQATINDTRRAMGYSEEDIEQLAQEDAKKEERWQNGYAYMNRRNELLATSSNSDTENQLAELREQFFKQEASTIAAEESAGFFRYKRPRYYGRN